jgi:5-methylcytosine-specific restriction enzyme A
MDMVASAGLDVSDWQNFKGGRLKARANPKYCYEWAFVDPAKTVVVTLWFRDLKDESGLVEQRFNLKNANAVEVSPVRRARRNRMLEALQTAHKRQLPVRVIMVDGKQGELGKTTSVVNMRKLDAVPWAVAQIRSDGEIILRRGLPAAKLVDQFAVDGFGTDNPEQRVSTGKVYSRDPKVREQVLLRAMGLCEYCSTPGFKMADGSIYLETHHVVSLSEGGADRVSNVVALRPNHHREAHHGAAKFAIRTFFIGADAADYTPGNQ